MSKYELNIDKLPSFVEKVYIFESLKTFEQAMVDKWICAIVNSYEYVGTDSAGFEIIIFLRSLTLAVSKDGHTILDGHLQETFPKLSETSDPELLAFHVEFGVGRELLHQLREILTIFKMD